MNKKTVFKILIVLIITLAIIETVALIVKHNLKQQRENTIIQYENLDNAKIENGEKVNISEKAKTPKNIDGLTISLQNAISENDGTNITISAQNTSNTRSEETYLRITCVKENGEQIGQMYVYINAIDPGGTTTSSAIIGADYLNLYDYYIEKVEE